MLNLKLQTRSIKKNVVKALKKAHRSPARLSEIVVAAVCPAVAKTLSEREQEVRVKETVHEAERANLQTQRTTFVAEQAAEGEKSSSVTSGAATPFQANGLHSQQGLVQQRRAADDIVIMERECDQSTTAFLAAAAAVQTAATPAALKDESNADNTTAAQLRQALEAAQGEHVQLQTLTNAVEARSKQLEKLVSCAASQQDQTGKYLQAAFDQCARFEELTQAVEARAQELENLLLAARNDRAETSRQVHAGRLQSIRLSIAAEAIELTQGVVEREEERIIKDMTLEMQKKRAALAEERASFERLRAAEKADLAKRRAHIEELCSGLEAKKQKVKEEKEKVRLLGVEAELERVASVDAKRAALEELEMAFTIREEANRASRIAEQKAAEDLKVTRLRESNLRETANLKPTSTIVTKGKNKLEGDLSKKLEDARLETERRKAALAEVCEKFERLRVAEEAEVKAEKLKEENEQTRRLGGVNAELERAISVGAKSLAPQVSGEEFAAPKDGLKTASLSVKQSEAAADREAARLVRTESQLVIVEENARPTTTIDPGESRRDEKRDHGARRTLAVYKDGKSDRIPSLKIRPRPPGFKVCRDDKFDFKPRSTSRDNISTVLSPKNGREWRTRGAPKHHLHFPSSSADENNIGVAARLPGAQPLFGLKAKEQHEGAKSRRDSGVGEHLDEVSSKRLHGGSIPGGMGDRSN